jgi:hypothetical protein
MGLLDDLKKQAESVKTQKVSLETMGDERLKLVDNKMKQTFTYVNELLKQLAVVKPVNPMIYSVPGIGDLRDLVFTDSFIDYRRKRMNDKEYIDTITFFLKWSLGTTLLLERDMPVAVQKVRDTLFSYNLKFTEDEIKNARGAVANTKFKVQSIIVTDVAIKADYEQGRLQILAKNLLRLGPDDFVLPAGDVNDAMLEDFAKTLIGQQGNFRRFRGMPGALR